MTYMSLEGATPLFF